MASALPWEAGDSPAAAISAPPADWLTAAEAAAALGVTASTVRRWCAAGRLRGLPCDGRLVWPRAPLPVIN